MRRSSRLVAFLVPFALIGPMLLGSPAATADGDPQYVTQTVTFAGSGTSADLSMMIVDGHIYAAADGLASRLSYDCTVADTDIVCSPTLANAGSAFNKIVFHGGSDAVTVSYPVLGLTNLAYKAPFASVINDKGAWVPFEMFLLLANTEYLITDRGLYVGAPKQTAIDVLQQVWSRELGSYSFDWVAESGLTAADLKTVNSNFLLANVFNGLLKFDPASWGMAFTQIVGDTTPYDKKYGQTLATMFATNSEDELRGLADSVETLGTPLDWMFGNISDVTTVTQAQSTLQEAAMHLSDLNPSSVRTYNSAYANLETALGDQEAVSQWGTAATLTVGEFMKFLSYTTEFKQSDDFSLDALDGFLSVDANGYLPAAARDKFRETMTNLRTTPANYAVSRLVENDWLSIGSTLASAAAPPLADTILGPASAALLAWNIVSGLVPFYSNGLSAADSFELSVYATLFQTDALSVVRSAYQADKQAWQSPVGLTSDSLRSLTTNAYTYLKTCYITRQAAIVVLESMLPNNPSTYPQLTAKNATIADEMAQLKVIASGSATDETMLGFLPDMNTQYLTTYDDTKLVTYLQDPPTPSPSADCPADLVLPDGVDPALVCAKTVTSTTVLPGFTAPLLDPTFTYFGFKDPTDNLACAWYDRETLGTVTCRSNIGVAIPPDPRWSDPDHPSNYMFVDDTGSGAGFNGGVTYTSAIFKVVDAPELAYGQTVLSTDYAVSSGTPSASKHPVACHSAEDGITCWDTVTHYGMKISQSEAVYWPVPPNSSNTASPSTDTTIAHCPSNIVLPDDVDSAMVCASTVTSTLVLPSFTLPAAYGDGDPLTNSWGVFTSPTGNLACSWFEYSTVRCKAHTLDVPYPDDPRNDEATQALTCPDGMWVGDTGAGAACSSAVTPVDLAFDAINGTAKPPVLEYGQTVLSTDITWPWETSEHLSPPTDPVACHSAEDGITCWNTVTHAGMKISRSEAVYWPAFLASSSTASPSTDTTIAYQAYDIGMTWDDAKAYCEARGQHLATITSAADQAAAAQVVEKGTMESYWLGAEEVNGTWSWITGQDFGYTNWDASEPNGSGDRLQMYRSIHGSPVANGWDDTFADGDHGYGLQYQQIGTLCES